MCRLQAYAPMLGGLERRLRNTFLLGSAAYIPGQAKAYLDNLTETPADSATPEQIQAAYEQRICRAKRTPLAVYPVEIPDNVKRIVVHWSAGNSYNVTESDRKRYHVIIDGSGNVHKGNTDLPKHTEGGHTALFNTGTIGVTVCAMNGKITHHSKDGSALGTVTVKLDGKTFQGEESLRDEVSDNNKRSADTHTVKSGETLLTIAKRQLGNATLWKKIQDLNKIKDPAKIAVGDKLQLPRQKRDFDEEWKAMLNKFKPIKPLQWKVLAEVVADLCYVFDIPPNSSVTMGSTTTDYGVLAHGEVDQYGGPTQAYKWDPLWLYWKPEATRKEIGQDFRKLVVDALAKLS